MTEASRHLLAVDYPAEFTQGAHSAVTTCLQIEPAEKVTLITDRACSEDHVTHRSHPTSPHASTRRLAPPRTSARRLAPVNDGDPREHD